ncbi:SRR1-LIKE PROTEIN [Salix koriyanagi]|uniref:SRR1-LIKE PROTEIN n=1 Tax=Salix koriyanagi TaxID=2511006 RepID=A0A9Q0QAB0_9ROSI|nr:SRR1-LIKE PROTEIN [Salix koriyanagi]
MEASAKLALDNHTKNEDWTVVLPRRGKKLTCSRRNSTPEAKQQSWVPAESESDPDRGLKLIQKMGNLIESYETPRFQLSLAILMKRKFDWIGDMEVFDPILSATESRVLESLGCSVLSVNEHGRRRVTKPTLFYMPHCEAELYNNLLQANWELELLNHIVLFGNSFEMYEFLSEIKKSFVVDSTGHILAARKFTEEYVIKIASDDYLTAFHDSSWHFFSPSLDTELLLVK